MASSGSFLKQLSGRESSNSSRRWGTVNKNGGGCERSLEQMEGLGIYGGSCVSENGGLGMRKRVMVVVDQSSCSKNALLWALTHVTSNGDMLTLLKIIPPSQKDPQKASVSSSSCLTNSLGSLCRDCQPEVEVEALVIQGPNLATIMSQVKKLEVSVLVLGQQKPSPLIINCLRGSSRDDFVEQCINSAECLTFGVRRQSKGMGGYLISTRWQKNFWLLA